MRWGTQAGSYFVVWSAAGSVSTAAQRVSRSIQPAETERLTFIHPTIAQRSHVGNLWGLTLFRRQSQVTRQRAAVFGTSAPPRGFIFSLRGWRFIKTTDCINNGRSICDVTHWCVDFHFEASSLDFGCRRFFWSRRWAYLEERLADSDSWLAWLASCIRN